MILPAFSRCDILLVFKIIMLILNRSSILWLLNSIFTNCTLTRKIENYVLHKGKGRNKECLPLATDNFNSQGFAVSFIPMKSLIKMKQFQTVIG